MISLLHHRYPIRRIAFSLLTTALLVAFQTRTAAVEAPAWQISDPSIVNPESVYYSAEEDVIFVSNVVGDELTKDGQGWISKISPEGQLIDAKWVEGLNAPHGMRAHQGQLWVADIDELVAIDLQTAQIISKIKIPGATFLNDVAIAEDGRVFVSDTLNSKIYMVHNGQVSSFAGQLDLESPNGLLVQNNQLIVAAWGPMQDPATFSTKRPGHLYAIDLAAPNKDLIVRNPLGNLDGVESTVMGNLLVSDYNAGEVFQVDRNTGKSHKVLSGLEASADIGYIPERNLLLVPNLTQSTITAYQLPHETSSP